MTDNSSGAPASAGVEIAIVGMAAHLPGAGSTSAYWENLAAGIESIRRLSEAELLAAGESQGRMRAPNYVPAAAPLDGFERFDAEFFGLSPKEAAIMDPQHRQFLEVAWEALEDAGLPPERFPGPVGVFAGCGMGSYFYFNLCSNPELVRGTGMFLLRHTGNDKDFLATRVSHVLDLKGPSVSVQTACSTSLVAVHMAALALAAGECDLALAGGVTIELPQLRGYLHEQGEILSPDGHCHAFDHRAEGTVFGSGAGCVALRRLDDALAAGDRIWAVIRGTAVNNDGAAKAGYLAPSVDGQAAAIAAAHKAAGVSADTIGYVECHGTGTYLGDPIEVAALSQAFAETTEKVGFCRIGSVKTNIGHTDTAAGVASLIKAALSLHHRQLPPSLGYEAPNPAIDFETSPFRVNDRLSDFPALGAPRRAGVNSLGVGGTNAHAVLEEAPARAASEESDWPFQLLVLSARTKTALDAASRNLAAHLRARPDQKLADVAFTLKEGRRAFEHRRVLVAESHAEAARLLEEGDPRRVFAHQALAGAPEVVFMFPGGGAQYAGMARDLYETEPVFRDWMDRGLDWLAPRLDYDLKALWLPEPGAMAEASERLRKPSVQLPLIMIAEYALAQLWMSWGVRPAALVGHSMGENVAACLAGVMSFEDCLGLVLLRGRLFDEIPAGGMLSVPLSEAELRPLLGADLDDGLDMASVNAPELCVVSGPDAGLDALAARLAAREVETQRIRIDIAAHSRMLVPILERFGDYLRSIPLSAPTIPVISNRSGKPLTAAEATDPDYWVGHLRHAVMFGDCVRHLAGPDRVFLEVGPGRALASLAQANGVPSNQALASLRHPEQEVADDAHFIATLGRLWALGVPVDWAPLWGEARRLKVDLPTYPFQRQPYFIAPGAGAAAPEAETWPERVEDLAAWGWKPVWRPREADLEEEVETAAPRTWLVFADEAGLAARVIARLRAAGHRVVEVRAGDAFARTGPEAYVIAPERGREDYDRLAHELVAQGFAPARIAHFWLTTEGERHRPGSSFFHRCQEQGFYSLVFLAQALAEENLPRPIHLVAVTTGAARVRGEPLPHPEKATLAGPLRVIPRELPGVTCASLDVALPEAARRGRGREREAGLDRLAAEVIEDLLAEPANHVAARRDGRRFELAWRKAPLAPAATPLPDGAVCLITGGFGGVGLTLAARLHAERGARIALLSRQPLPPREAWAARLRIAAPGDRLAARIRAVEALEAAGAEVMVVAGDVCNLEEMRAARAAVEARFGRIDALIHAAGVVDDAPLLAKSPAAIEEVFAPKIHGTRVLAEAFPDGAVGRIVLFSSTSTIVAPAGQVDYVAANEFLNAWAQSRAGARTSVAAIDWGIWAEVGMAAEALAAPAPPPVEPVAAPLLDAATFDAAGDRLFTARWSTGLWAIGEHRTAAGEALLPGTGYLELAAEALKAQGEPIFNGAAFEIRDLYFLRPLAVPDGATRDMRLRLARTDEGYDLAVQSAVDAEGRIGFQLNAEARIGFGVAPSPRLDLAAIEARCRDGVREDAGGLRVAQEAHLDFGPRWRVLRREAYGEGEGIARLALPAAFRGDLAQGWLLHPALLDLATGWAMGLIDGYEPRHLWAPVSYGAVRVHRPLPAEIRSWARASGENRAEDPFARFDVTLTDPSGEVCVEVEGFVIRRLEGGLDLAARPDPRALEFPPVPGEARAPSPAEARLRHNLAQGIRAEEGAEAFGRALALGLPQVVVSSMELPALIAQAGTGAEETGEGQSFARPDLDTAYVEPRNDIERTLVGFWQELLGVGQVGVEDSFFDLGGHSLIAVRLFAMIRKAYGADFPISVLFEAPTIAACAALIEARIGPREAAGTAAGTGAAPAPARRFAHLVPMHQGEGGPRTPFFLVAGMFGNVLNLRHLAQLVGTDRRFYGLQARGLYGGEAPHMTLEEAAADYLAELRQVQPHGPYLLGGFSGGGLTAWEMARQLEAAGEEVALVVLLDTPLPVRPGLSRADKLLIRAAELREKGPGFVGEWLAAKRAWREAARARAEAPEEAAHEFHDRAIEAAFRHAIGVYDLQPRPGRAVLYRPPLDRRFRVTGGRFVSAGREYVHADNLWTPFAPGLEVVETPGDHDSMVLEPNVRVLAARLRAAIRDAEAAAGRAEPGAAFRTAAE